MTRTRRVSLIISGLLLASIPALAGTITVYVGYADNLRSSGFFPSPWLGSPGVVSETPGGETLDTGAIRIDNSGPSSVTISSMTVVLNPGAGPVTFNFWNPLVIPSGDSGIFTQTFSYNFDSSDYGIFGGGPVNVDATHPLGGCTNPADATQAALCNANAPVVSFSVDGGAVTSFTDSGHILDTFGYDLINLPPPGGDGNESINWNLIGTNNGRGGGSVPEPSTFVLVSCALLGAGVWRRRRLFTK